jgi:hypothetical protein
MVRKLGFTVVLVGFLAVTVALAVLFYGGLAEVLHLVSGLFGQAPIPYWGCLGLVLESAFLCCLSIIYQSEISKSRDNCIFRPMG